MALRGLYVFTHDTAVGKAQAQSLFELVTIRRNDGVSASRAFSDYYVSVDEKGVPEGISLESLVG